MSCTNNNTNTNTLEIPCTNNNTMLVQISYDTDTVQVQHKYSTKRIHQTLNVIQKRHKHKKYSSHCKSQSKAAELKQFSKLQDTTHTLIVIAAY